MLTMAGKTFKGKVVIVTGSGSNLGRALARRFFDEGARVVVSDRDKESISATYEELAAIDKSRVRSCPCDVADEKAAGRLIACATKSFGALDVLVNNAAHQGIGPRFPETSVELFDAVMSVNARGVFLCSQAAARQMLKRKQGVIINIGSNTAERAIRGRTAYIASKGAIEALTRAMAVDLAPTIRVNEVAPGYIWTSRWKAISAKARKIRLANIPLHEPASFDDVAEVVLFLASDKAKNITGARYVVDGGCCAQHVPEAVDR
jgi:Dehydrogenases with different specificities (related to short-chain alcohol dehydrogenases)